MNAPCTMIFRRCMVVSPVPEPLALAIARDLRPEDRREVEETTGAPCHERSVWECVGESFASYAAVDLDTGAPICAFGGSGLPGWTPGQPFTVWELGTGLVERRAREFLRVSPLMVRLLMRDAGSKICFNIVPEWYAAARRWLERIGAEFEPQTVLLRGVPARGFTLHLDNLKAGV